MPDRRLIDDPEFWRSRAEECRAIANDMKEAEAKAIMDRIARDYERLAMHAEPRRKSNRHSGLFVRKMFIEVTHP